MSNGVAVRLYLVEPPSAHPNSTEVEIGKAAAAAVVAIAMGVIDWQAQGAMTPATRTWSGAMLGRVAELNLAHLGPQDDFNAIVRRQGKRAMQGCPDAVLLAHLGRPGQVDAVIDDLLGYVIAISEKVVREELAFRAN